MFKLLAAFFIGCVGIIVGNVFLTASQFETVDAKVLQMSHRCQLLSGSMSNCSSDEEFVKARKARSKPSYNFVGYAEATVQFVSPVTKDTEIEKVRIEPDKIEFFTLVKGNDVRISAHKNDEKKLRFIEIKES